MFIISKAKPLPFAFSHLKNIRKYKGSAAQTRLHEFDQNEANVNHIKKNIDYDMITRESEGKIMIREFLFQEERPSVRVDFPRSNVVWLFESIWYPLANGHMMI
jgi:hypothetical protein